MWVKPGGRFLQWRNTWWWESFPGWWTETTLLILNVSGSVLTVAGGGFQYVHTAYGRWHCVSDECHICMCEMHVSEHQHTAIHGATGCQRYLSRIALRPRRHQVYWDVTCHPFHSVLRDTSCTETLLVIHFTPPSETTAVQRRYLSSISPLLQRQQLYRDVTCHPFHLFFRDNSCTETLLSSISPLLQRHQLYRDITVINFTSSSETTAVQRQIGRASCRERV